MNFYFDMINFILSFIRFFNKHLASAPGTPNTVLGARGTKMKKKGALHQKSL